MSASRSMPPIGSGRWGTKLVIALLVSCGVAVVATTLFILVQILRMQVDRVGEVVRPEVVETPPAPVEEPTAAPFTQAYELQGMTISLGNRNQTVAAYAEFTLVLDCPNKASHRWMEMNRAVIRDALYEATVAYTVEDFNTSEGFSRIKASILSILKERFGPRAPRDLALRDWVIR